MQFWKLSACGNDFVLVQDPGPEQDLVRLACELCRRRFSLGADGLVVVRDAGPRRIAVEHYEPTGERTFCLNALRGACAFAASEGIVAHDERLELETELGVRPATCIAGKDEFTVGLPPPGSVTPLSVSLPSGGTLAGTLIDVGNPQFVVRVDPVTLAGQGIMERARELRWSLAAFPRGTNVSLIAALGRDQAFRIRTYERGVEGETLSCGTGAVAAAIALDISEAHFLTRGGEEQHVRVERDDAGRVCKVWSTASARVIARGTLARAA